MFLGRKAFQFMLINLAVYLRHCFGNVKDWDADDFKRRVGISKSAFKLWYADFYNGHRKINMSSLSAISFATGIRVPDLTKGLINMKTYDFDYKVSKQEFQALVLRKYGIRSQFGLDKTKRYQGKNK